MFEGFTSDYLEQENTLKRTERYVIAGPIMMAPAIINSIATVDIKQEKALIRTERFVISGPIIIATAICYLSWLHRNSRCYSSLRRHTGDKPSHQVGASSQNRGCGQWYSQQSGQFEYIRGNSQRH